MFSPVFDLDVVAAVAQEEGVSLYEAEDMLNGLFAVNDQEGE
jgi:hypothetical protein